MLHIKIHDGRVDTIEVEGLAETEAAISFLIAYTAFIQNPPSADVHSTKLAPGRALNPDDVAAALRAIGRPSSSSELRAPLTAQDIQTTVSRRGGDIREAMRVDPQQRFTRNAAGQAGRWMLHEWSEASSIEDASHPKSAADSLRAS